MEIDEERRIIATTAIGKFQFLYSLSFKLSKYKQKCQGTEAAKNHKNTHINRVDKSNTLPWTNATQSSVGCLLFLILQ